MPNRLAAAASPYLRQHADNPVDWYEWGEEAFARAEAEDKPIFLSVGYAACHWCHVMAHESFEDPFTAEVLNERFVNIKVDREERPDVDSVYMDALQAMTGHGGWPMSVFCTPDGRPFYAGTYWPAEERHGMPSFRRVLDAIWDAWTTQRDEIETSAGKVTAHIQQMQRLEPTGDVLDPQIAADAVAQAAHAWDPQHGGFGQEPKFPHPMTLDFLLTHHARTGDEQARQVAVHSLEAMSRGGIFDHVGGGFARYAVDRAWEIPHFEKMLYDNALLLRAYTHAWQVTGAPRFRRTVDETAAFLLADLRQSGGAFSSSLDADSPGHATHPGGEGAFYVWTDEEFRAVVSAAGEDPDRWATTFGVTPGGNVEGTTVLTERNDPGARLVAADSDNDNPAGSDSPAGSDDPTGSDDPAGDPDHEAARARVRAALEERRRQRPRPGLDDKVLASWNGLAIGALAEAGAIFDEPAWIAAARGAAEFLTEHLVVEGALRHAWKDGHGPTDQTFAEDLAAVAQGLLALYEADHDRRWVAWARDLVADADERFAERDATGTFTGAYHATPDDGEELVARPKGLVDNAVPAPSSALADAHLRLAALTGETAHAERAEAILGLFAARAAQVPTGFGELLCALERHLAGPREVAIVGAPGEPGTDDLLGSYRAELRPGTVLAVGEPDTDGATVPLLAGRTRLDGAPTAYVCEHFACQRPTSEPRELLAQLRA